MKAVTPGMTSVPRPGSSLVSFWAVVAVGVLVFGDALFAAQWMFIALAVAPAALIILAAWMLLYWPSIRFDTQGLTIHNPGRTIDVPWARLESVSQRFQVVLELDDGKRVTCWGSPFPEKPGLRRSVVQSSSALGTNGRVAAAIESAHAAAPARTSDAPVQRRWSLVPLAAAGILLIVCVFEVVFAR